MQNKARAYARAMVEVLGGATKKETEKKVRRLKTLLYKRGDFKHISKILQEFARAWEERKGRMATVTSAQPLAENTRIRIEESLGRGGYVIEEKVDESVLGGVAVSLGNEYLIDATMKGKIERFVKKLQ